MAVTVVVVTDKTEVARYGADLVAALVRNKPDAVLGLAAGATPEGLYAEMVNLHAGGLDFSRVTVFDLDEYHGLPPGHPAAFARSLRAHLIDHLNLSPLRVHLLEDRLSEPLSPLCAEYERLIRQAGGIDLQLLGLGRNGHIAFNEPGSDFASRTRPVDLSETTRAANRAAFASGEAVPTTAVTMGIGTILEARRILLLATGLDKAEAVAASIQAPPTPQIPASALQGHPDTLFLLDRMAASRLTPTPPVTGSLLFGSALQLPDGEV